ncbi:unnamed protein product [Prorocentrum cordatum]|uniref:Mannosyltransferase n=1 Tax=Prorocentrum cordatum TaxID=2364126 RepID=A0ABN9VN50_9DINO|nr:unnamed protein product [Polarella glacialis]
MGWKASRWARYCYTIATFSTIAPSFGNFNAARQWNDIGWATHGNFSASEAPLRAAGRDSFVCPWAPSDLCPRPPWLRQGCAQAPIPGLRGPGRHRWCARWSAAAPHLAELSRPWWSFLV